MADGVLELVRRGAVAAVHHATLPVPVTFVCRNPDRWPELFDGRPWPPTLDEVHERVVTHEDLAIVQTAVLLAGAGYPVRLAPEAVADTINVVSSVDLRISDRTAQRFIVAFRSDWARPYLADLTLTMNATIATRRCERAMPHWVQTGLVERDRSRSPRVRTLAFKGDFVNLAEAFRSPQLIERLHERGVDFVAHVYDHATRTSGWNDYRNVDAVIAVRDISPVEVATKPASKLINAWAAGVPAILGPEPSYQELRASDLDYIEVTQPQQLLDAIDRLNDDPHLYASMVDHGRVRAAAYTNDTTIRRWVDYLSRDAADAYHRWAQHASLFRSVRYTTRALQQRVENELFSRRQSTR